MSLVQVNYRVPSELRDAIKARADELGVKQSELVRRGLEAALVADRGLFGPIEGSALVRSPLAHRTREKGSPLDLAQLLCTWTGMPKAIMVRRIEEGRVTINGEVVTDRHVSWVGSRDEISLDGARV